MRFALGNLTIFDDAWLSVLENDQADWFFGGALADDFSCYTEIVEEGIADEGRVSNADETIIDTVGVDMLDFTALEVVEYAACDKRQVQTSVSVGSNGNLSISIQPADEGPYSFLP